MKENFVLVVICLAALTVGILFLIRYLKKNKNKVIIPFKAGKPKKFAAYIKDLFADPADVHEAPAELLTENREARSEMNNVGNAAPPYENGTRIEGVSDEFIMEQLDSNDNTVATFGLDRIFLDNEGVFILRPDPEIDADERDIILKETPESSTVSRYAYCLQRGDKGELLLFMDDSIKEEAVSYGKIYSRKENGKKVNPMYRFDLKSNEWVVDPCIVVTNNTRVCLGAQVLRFTIRRAQLPKPANSLVREPESHRSGEAAFGEGGTKPLSFDELVGHAVIPKPDSQGQKAPERKPARRAPIKRQ